MTENYKQNRAYRGEPKPPEEVDVKKIVNILYEKNECLKKRRKAYYCNWRQPLEQSI